MHHVQRRPYSTRAERVLPSPAKVGGYCIDGGKDSHRMATQLVLSELHRVQGLVNQFSPTAQATRTREPDVPIRCSGWHDTHWEQ